jgi:hypothetical protein
VTRWDAARQQEWAEHHDGPVPDPAAPFWTLLGVMLGALAVAALLFAIAYRNTH